MSFVNKEVKPVEPKYDGMTLVEMKWIPLTTINRKNKLNTARTTSIGFGRIIKIGKVIKAKNYLPYAYEPPMVEWNEEVGKYDLLTGNNRYQAFGQVGEKEIWVAVVKFDTDKNREIAKSLENAEDKEIDFGQDYRTIEDVENIAKGILLKDQENGIEITVTLMKETLAKLKVTKKDELNPILVNLGKNFGVTSNVANWSKKELNKFAQDLSDDTGKMVITKTFRSVGDGPRADGGNFNSVMKIKSDKGAGYPITIAASFNEVEEKDIKTARKNRKIIFKKYEDDILKKAKIIKSKNYKTPDWVFVDQIASDYN